MSDTPMYDELSDENKAIVNETLAQGIDLVKRDPSVDAFLRLDKRAPALFAKIYQAGVVAGFQAHERASKRGK